MAMMRFPVAQVAVASCLLVLLSPLTAAYDYQTGANSEEIQSWMESLIQQYHPTSAEAGQQQQQTHYFTQDQVNYIKSLLNTMKLENVKDDVKQEIVEHFFPKGSEENVTQQEPQTTTPADSGEESEESKEYSEEQTTVQEQQTTTPAESGEQQVKQESYTTPGNSGEQVTQEPYTIAPADSEEQSTQEPQSTTPEDSGEQVNEESEENTTQQELRTITPTDSDELIDEDSEEQTAQEQQTTTPSDSEEQTTTPSDSEEQTTQEQTTTPSDSEEQTTQEQQTTTPSDSEEQTTAPSDSEEQTTTPSDSEEQTTTPSDSEEQTTTPSDSEEETTQELQTTTPSDSEEQTSQQNPQTTTPDDSEEQNEDSEEENEHSEEDDESHEESAETITSTTLASTTTETTTTTTTAATTTEVTTTPEAITTTATTQPEPVTTTTTSAESTTTITPSLELCNNCVVHHGVGYAVFPGYCDAYIQCRFYGAVPTAVFVRRCPSGQYWNQDKLTCDFEANVKCTPVNNCPNHKAIPGDWAAYLVYNGQNWARETCPAGRTYNTVTCGCTDKHGDDDGNHKDCSDKKAIAGDKTGFLQFTGNGWVRMACPATVGYSELTCGCTEKLAAETPSIICPYSKPIPGDRSGFLQFTGVSWIPRPCPATLVYDPYTCVCTYDKTNAVDDGKNKHDTLCKATVALNFDSNDATDSSPNHFWVNNTGVTFNGGKAYFNGKSRLTIPGLSNMEFGSTVYALIKYKHSSANSKQTLVANGDCQVRQSLAVCSGKDSVDFYAESKEQISLGKITVPSDIGAWQYAVYALDNGSLTGSVGANKVSQPVKGALDRRQRGLVIGGGGDCDNFHGIIDEVQVFLCKPSL